MLVARELLVAAEPTSGALDPKGIPLEERLIVALDVPTAAEAREFVGVLGNACRFYKIGLELLMTGEYFDLLEWLIGRGKKVFADLKLFDVPNTVEAAVRQLAGRGITFVTVHGNDTMLEAACRAREDVKILAVTALTSLDRGDMEDLGFHTDVSSLVLSRARRALAIGCDGVVSSGHEASALRAELGGRILIVVPGIRPVANVDDQKRTVDVEDAFRLGADYIVVGRPIRSHLDPKAEAGRVQQVIRSVFGN